MNQRDALEAMELAALAYKRLQPEPITGTLTVIDDPVSGVQCYARQSGVLLTIAFRGTHSAKDWQTDFTFVKKTLPYGNHHSKIRVHAGFLKAYKNPIIRGKLHTLVTGEVKKIVVCGHSYGAALAALCVVDLEYNFPDRDMECYLFGCPRVGNRAFAESFDRRIFKTLRFVNGNDMITKLPFAFMGYQHVGIPIHLGTLRLPGRFSAKEHSAKEYYRHLFEGICCE